MDHTQQDYITAAIKYLSPIRLIEKQIQSIRKEICQLRSNITSIGAIDYSKDRVSGGGTPVGIEASVARFMDTAKEKDRKIEELSKQYCDASIMIDSLQEAVGAVILRYEYILGLPTKEAYKMVGYGETQSKEYKRKALEELGEKLVNSDPNRRKPTQKTV